MAFRYSPGERFVQGSDRNLSTLPVRFQRFTAPVGTDVDVGATGWQVQCVQVDNPTGSWLIIQPYQIFVAPWTLGFQTDLYPPTADLKVQFSTGPSGIQSSQIGGSINVVAYDQKLGSLNGILISNDSTLATYTFATQNVSVATSLTTAFQVFAGANYCKIRYFEFMQTGNATIQGPVLMALQRITAAGTGGTVRIAIPHDPTDVAATTTGMDNPAVEPTFSGQLGPMWGSSFVTNGIYQPVYKYDFLAATGKPFILAPGSGISFRTITGVAGGTAMINFQFTESPI